MCFVPGLLHHTVMKYHEGHWGHRTTQGHNKAFVFVSPSFWHDLPSSVLYAFVGSLPHMPAALRPFYSLGLWATMLRAPLNMNEWQNNEILWLYHLQNHIVWEYRPVLHLVRTRLPIEPHTKHRSRIHFSEHCARIRLPTELIPVHAWTKTLTESQYATLYQDRHWQSDNLPT